MAHGIDRYDDKQKRAMRRRNHIALDLADGKYRQRIKPSKRKRDYYGEDEDDYS